MKYLYDLEKLYIIFFCKSTTSDEQVDFSPSTSVFRHTGSYIYNPSALYLTLVPKSILLQDLSAASNEIYTRPRLCLTLVLKSILPNTVSTASFKIYTLPTLYLRLVLKSIPPNIVSDPSFVIYTPQHCI